MGFFDKVKDALITSDESRAKTAQEAQKKAGTGRSEAQEKADRAQREADEAARRAADPADGTTADDAVEKQRQADEVSRQEISRQAEEARADEPAQAGRHRTHTVQPGDTLSGIAASHGVDWQEMARLNNLDNPDLIYPGQVFKVPDA